jgi:hypothetical protein
MMAVLLEVVIGDAGSGHQALAATDSEGRLLVGGKEEVTVNSLLSPPFIWLVTVVGRKATAVAAAVVGTVGSSFTLIGGDRPSSQTAVVTLIGDDDDAVADDGARR